MNNINPNQVIDFLNSLIALDRGAVTDLIEIRVECNKELASHDTVQVLSNPDETYSVGLLGILNGMCGKDENGWGYIVAQFNESGNKIKRFIHSKDKPKV